MIFQASPNGHINKAMIPDRCLLLLVFEFAGVVLDDVIFELFDDGGGTKGRAGGVKEEEALGLSKVVFVDPPS